MNVSSSNPVTTQNCRPATQFGCAGFFGRHTRLQRPFPAAVGGFCCPTGTNRKPLTILMIFAALVAALATGCTRQEARDPDGNATASSLVRALDESNFESEVRSGVVLVDFWATWCGPCKMQAPIVEQVAGRMEGKAKVAKLDVDKAPKIAQRFGVRAIPTLVVFKDGKPEKQFVGFTKAETLISGITTVLDSR
jgi:thioredoxin 1